MYVPPHFRESDEAKLLDVIREHGFAVLVCRNATGRMLATHLPLTLVVDDAGQRILRGHVSRANLIWQSFSREGNESGEALAIFSGPHSYVSPRWYNHVNVPTWNYIAVHAYGVPRVIADDAELRAAMKGLVDQYESETGIPAPYRMEDLPEDFLRSQIKGIVVFEMPIARLEASFKLSQNRDAESHANVMAELQQSGDSAAVEVAEAMRKHGKTEMNSTEMKQREMK